jgi:hypothetical protein
MKHEFIYSMNSYIILHINHEFIYYMNLCIIQIHIIHGFFHCLLCSMYIHVIDLCPSLSNTMVKLAKGIKRRITSFEKCSA